MDPQILYLVSYNFERLFLDENKQHNGYMRQWNQIHYFDPTWGGSYQIDERTTSAAHHRKAAITV